MDNLARKLRVYRATYDIKSKDLAKKLGITQRALIYIEKGQTKNPQKETMEKIRELGIDV